MNANDKKQIELPKEPHYVAATRNGWGVEMSGSNAIDGSNLDHAGVIGLPMINFTIEAQGIEKVRVRTNRGWLKYYNKFDNVNGFGNNTAITGIEIVGSGFIVGVHVKNGGWLNSVNTSDKEGEVFIGNGAVIDALWIDRV